MLCRGLQRIFGEPAAHRDEQAQALLPWLGVGITHQLTGIVAENPQRQRIEEDCSSVQDLMGSTKAGGAECCSTGLSGLHPAMLGAGRLCVHVWNCDKKIPAKAAGSW
jgi:hypothetical protein